MDVVTHCVREIMNSDIPERILEDAFVDRSYRTRRSPVSLESRISYEVFTKRILPDCNVAGGVEYDVPLAGLPFEKLDTFERIYNIPVSMTGGRFITQVLYSTLNVTSNYAQHVPGRSSKTFSTSPVENSVGRIVQSNRPMPNISNAEVEPLANNVLKIRDWQNFSADLVLRCLVEYSNNLNEIRPPWYPDFAKLAVEATKAYIYRKLSLELESTKLDGGRDFGRYKEFVDDYRDANQNYRSLMDELLPKVLLMNDPQRKQRSIMRAGRIRY